MSFKGAIEAQCPAGCEPFETEIWSFIRGDRDIELRDLILARECNLLLCPACNAAFIVPDPYVYFEPPREILAFVFPESYRGQEKQWREKMRVDFELMKTSMGKNLPLDVEPEIFFGVEELAQLLEREDYHGEEREVMEFIAKDMGLELYQVSPRYARAHGVPASLPYRASARGGEATAAAVVDGLEKIIAANDRLKDYGRFLKVFKAQPKPSLPPSSTAKSS